jgi:signal transduction histidine kinase/CheY-like chemotaxis protein
MLPTLQVSDTADSFEEQLVKLIAHQPRRMLLPLSLSIVLIAGMASRTAPLAWLIAWIAFAGAVMLVRVYVQDPRRLIFLGARQRLQLAVALVALSGTTHGLSLFFFAAMSSFEQAVLSMMLVGLCAGAVATAAGYRPIFLAYVIPTLGPLAILWAANPVLRDVGWIQGLMALLIVLFALVLNALAGDTYKIIRESYEIRQKHAALNRELVAANRAKTRFLASASHDLRQPMQTLSLFAAALALRPLDERSRAIVDNLNEALRDLTAELDALLDISKLDAGVVRAERAAFALKPVLDRLAAIFAPAATSKSLALTVDCPNDAWVSSDRKLIERIVRNLLENAVKYTDAGSITLSAQAEIGAHVLSIADTGCGIETAEHERVFEEFYQINNPERDRARGLGLGLSIVKRLVDLLGIELSMTSAPGQGTRFALQLPQAAEPASAASSAPPQESRRTRLDVRVLLVDDEEGIRRGVSALLEEHGCHVDVASGTEEALAVSAREPADLVIADFRLRGEDNGIETVRRLRRARPDLPALLLSGETAPERLREAEQAGIQVLHKPVSPQLLMQEISKVFTARIKAAGHGERQARGG